MSVFSNTQVQDVSTRSIFPNAEALIDDTISFTQGDLLCIDTTTHLIRRLAADTDAATLLGVAPVTIVNGRYQQSYVTAVDASLKAGAIPGPQYGSTYNLVLKSGEVLVAGQLVYPDPSNLANGVVAAGGMGIKPVGVYQGAGITATAATQVEVLAIQNYIAGV